MAWNKIWVLILTLLIQPGCASLFSDDPATKSDPELARDRRECRDRSSLNQLGRDSAESYRAQAQYNRCMSLRGRSLD